MKYPIHFHKNLLMFSTDLAAESILYGSVQAWWDARSNNMYSFLKIMSYKKFQKDNAPAHTAENSV